MEIGAAVTTIIIIIIVSEINIIHEPPLSLPSVFDIYIIIPNNVISLPILTVVEPRSSYQWLTIFIVMNIINAITKFTS
jgi:hypothetical protein